MKAGDQGRDKTLGTSVRTLGKLERKREITERFVVNYAAYT